MIRSLRPSRRQSFSGIGLATALILVALAGALGTHRAAWAGPRGAEPFHLRLVKSEPAKADSVAAAPMAIKLWFSQKPEIAVTRVTLIAGDGKEIVVGDPRLEGAEQTLVVADVKGVIGAGALTVSWKTSSGDGHIIKGEIPFVVRPGAASSAK